MAHLKLMPYRPPTEEQDAWFNRLVEGVRRHYPRGRRVPTFEEAIQVQMVTKSETIDYVLYGQVLRARARHDCAIAGCSLNRRNGAA